MKKKHQEWQDRTDSRFFIVVFVVLGLGMTWAASIVPARGWMLGIVALCCFVIAYGESRTKFWKGTPNN